MIAERKRLIRERARAARQGIPAEERAMLSRAACERLLVVRELASPGVVLGYAASPEELDVGPALAALAGRGWTVLLPRVTGPHTLSLHEVDVETLADPSLLEEGAFGIREPADARPERWPDEVGVAVVPGVAFDLSGRRLGHGGGFYDRLLDRMPRATRIGACFDGQVEQGLPAEHHDIHMHALVTPSRTLRF